MATYVAPARNVLTSLLVQVNVGSRGPPSPEIDQYKKNAYVSRSPKEPYDLLRDNNLGLCKIRFARTGHCEPYQKET